MTAPENAPLPAEPGASVPPVNEAATADSTAGKSNEGAVITPQPPADEFDEYEPLTPELVEDEAIRGDFVMRWAVVLLALLLGSTRIAETATLVHVKTGQYLAAHGILPPAHDVFSYTALERPWNNLSWGFDLLAAGIHAAGSFAGLSVFKAFMIAIAFWLIGSVSRPGLPTWWGSICSGAALLGCHLRLTAEPAIVTFVGMALALALVHHWRTSASSSKRLWLLVPLLLVWSNFDSRAWLGLVFVLLYAAGDTLGAWLKSSTALAAGARRELWTVAGVSLAATLVHPFGWKSLASPWFVYAVEYPAFRGYISEACLGIDRPPGPAGLPFFPMTTPAFWTSLDTASIAALCVIAAAAVTLILNRSRIDWGHVAAYVGFVLLSVACLHELPVAAIVSCVVATLNGQAWYAAACRQTYSIDTRELIFSRGGRVLTVLVLAGIAFFGGTGRLRDSTAAAARTGYGLDRNLEMQLDDLRRLLAGDASFDHRPFNTLLTQGDQLIWVGEQVFVDSRVGVYFDDDDEDNLLVQQILTRDAMRPRRERDSQKLSAGPQRTVWSHTFDKYRITHTVVRLMNPRDYEMFADLLQDSLHWEWTSLGAAAAVFYREANDVDYVDEEQFKKYLAAHTTDFRKQAYQGSDDRGGDLASRDRWIRPPSFYQRHFWSTKHEAPGEIHKAFHLARLASAQGLPQRIDRSRMAMVLLAIREAQAGLAKDPDAVNGYLVLGMAYDLLAQMEAQAAMNGSRSPRNGMRYLQSVAAYNQALLGDPDNSGAHSALFKIYAEAGKVDLALRHLEALDRILAANPDENAEDLLNVGSQLGELHKKVQTVEDQMAQYAATETNPLNLAQGYLQQGCVLKALKELERGGGQSAGTLNGEQLRILLMIEAGQVEEAYTAAARFGEVAEQSGLQNWADPVALASLTFADYSAAAGRWRKAADDAESRSLSGLLVNLAPHNSNYPWPLSTTTNAFSYLFQQPESTASVRVNVALTYLEAGQLQLAERFFREALGTCPDTLLRPFVAYYLRELTDGKTEIDLVSPSDRIIELFEPEP